MRHMHLAISQERNFLHCELCEGIRVCGDCQCDEHFLQIQIGGCASEKTGLEIGYGLHDDFGKQFKMVGDMGEVLQGVDDHCGRGSQEGRVFPGNDGAVVQLNGGATGYFEKTFSLCGSIAGRLDDGAVGYFEPLGGEDVLETFKDLFIDSTQCEIDFTFQHPANDFLMAGFLNGGIVIDCHTDHVDARIGRRLVGLIGGEEAQEEVPGHGECGDVAIVVDGGFSVCLEMERIDLVEIADIGGCRLVGDIDGGVEGEIPNGERFEFGVSGRYAAIVFVPNLREAGCEFSGGGTRGDDTNDGGGCFDVGVATKSVGAQNRIGIVGVA